VRDVLLPPALPSIGFTRLAWAFGWRTMSEAAAEPDALASLAQAAGLGWYINNARYFLNAPPMFAALVVLLC